MTVTFNPFSTSSFVIIMIIVLGSIILIIASICVFCCCCCCRTKGKGKIYQYDNSYKGDNLIYNWNVLVEKGFDVLLMDRYCNNIESEYTVINNLKKICIIKSR